VKDDNGRWDPGYITGSSRHIKANINKGKSSEYILALEQNPVFSANNISIRVQRLVLSSCLLNTKE
jgi:hypothetical protein